MNSAIKKIEEEDYSKVAELIYDTSTSLSEFIFGERKKNVPKIKQLVAMGNNSFSYENIRGYYLDKELVGLYVGYTGEKKSYYDGTADLYAFSRAFNIFKSLVLIFKTPVLSRLLTSNLKNNEYYISNLIVNSQFRRQGIGSFLLNHAVENARRRMHLRHPRCGHDEQGSDFSVQKNWI